MALQSGNSWKCSTPGAPGRRLGLLAMVTIGAAAGWLFSAAPSGRTLPFQATPPTAGTTVIGSVVDADLQPLSGVNVKLERAARVLLTTTSDAAGKFTFKAVAAGEYTVRAERAGLPTLTRKLQIPAGSASVRLPLVLVSSSDSPRNDAGASGGRGGAGRGAGGAVGATPPPLSSMPANSPPMQAASGERSSTVARQQLENAPAASGTDQNYLGYINIQPGVSSNNRIGGGGQGNMIIDAISPIGRTTTESYAHVPTSRFERTLDRPLSTFGADVDTASFTNVRRMLQTGHLPPSDAVRVEEFVNYFKFDYANPRGSHPIGLTTEIGDCPWAPTHKLVLIGARAVAPEVRRSEGRNLVLLVDVSRSMAPAERLPLLKTALSVFVDTLSPTDTISIVTYAGYSGVALPATPARNRDRILDAIARLGAGGSTNGGSGIILAYRAAREAYIPGGVNRVILATDGDFNVGITSQGDLLNLIQREKESGIFLSVLGVGSGNLRDSTMEMLADKGNGHYAYLDSLQEARRVLVREADATLETVAKEVKFQVEFNPAHVAAWKQIGYENRVMAARDFNDDRKDGGEVGAGHTVTVLYEVVPVGVATSDGDDSDGRRPSVDPLRYQDQTEVRAAVRPVAPPRATSDEWLTVKVRYQLPEGDTSRLIEQPVRPAPATARVEHLPFAAAVAEFGLLLRDDRSTIGKWDALARRVNALRVAPPRAADRDALAELVGLARSLKRIHNSRNE